VRLRWSDPEPDDPSTAVDWRFAALNISTLFLNLAFWDVPGTDLWMSYSLPFYAALLAAASLLIAALFFMGPALAAQALGRPLISALENSLGSIPAYLLRLCCVLFLTLWIAELVAVAFWLSSFVLRRDVSSTQFVIIAAAVLVFLFITGLQSLRTSAQLAVFTSKLGLALLVAALLRVHQGWPVILQGIPSSVVSPPVWNLWRGVSLLGFYLAPLALLAADSGHHSSARQQVAITGLMGIALPLFGTLLVVRVISGATFHSQYYRPSLSPNVAMALWGGVARSALPGPMMLAAIPCSARCALG
jgi:hypothetical protein